MNERQVSDWLWENYKKPMDWEMYNKVLAYVTEKARSLGVEVPRFLSPSFYNLEKMAPITQQSIYKELVSNLDIQVWSEIKWKKRERRKK